MARQKTQGVTLSLTEQHRDAIRRLQVAMDKQSRAELIMTLIYRELTALGLD